MTELQLLICSALRDEQPPWPPDADPATFLQQADIEGVAPLLHERLIRHTWPTEVREALRQSAIGKTMWELQHQRVLNEALHALSEKGVRPIFIKGTALAYSLYPNPVMRSRGDTDILVPLGSRELAEEALAASGFRRHVAIEGDWSSYQASFTRVAEDGTTHVIDLHWKINNSEVLSLLFTYDELLGGAIDLPALGELARGTSQVHSLLIACMHRATHRMNPYYVAGEAHHDPDRLIWLADIHWLAQALTEREWESVCITARHKGLSGIVAEGLQRTAAAWGTHIPGAVLESLVADGAKGLATRYLSAQQFEQWRLDWNARPGWKARFQWLLQTVLPSSAYMRQRYAHVQPQWIPWLYCRRAALGVFKRVARASGKAGS